MVTSRAVSGVEPVIVVGAGPAGLAVAACLKQQAIDATVLEAADSVGSSWRSHYRRLHLHTPKDISGLPGFAMPLEYPRFPSRQQLVDYLESYARHFEIEPRFGEAVERIERAGDESWTVRTSAASYGARNVVVATGYNRQPFIPEWPGIDEFEGEVSHSREYRDGEPYVGKRVLVVGTGNTGAEIVICLHEHEAADISLCVRSEVDVVPREFLGIPITRYAIFNQPLPLGVQDAITRTVSRVRFGNLKRWGLRPSGHPISRIVGQGRIPLIDIGTVDLIKKGRVRVVGAIERFTRKGVVVPEGELELDAVILATGYRTGLSDLVAESKAVLDERGIPTRLGAESQLPGLFFVGFSNPPTGLLRSIGIDAEKAASEIATRYRMRTPAA